MQLWITISTAQKNKAAFKNILISSWKHVLMSHHLPPCRSGVGCSILLFDPEVIVWARWVDGKYSLYVESCPYHISAPLASCPIYTSVFVVLCAEWGLVEVAGKTSHILPRKERHGNVAGGARSDWMIYFEQSLCQVLTTSAYEGDMMPFT
jgi:hypothetical protein